MKVIYLIPGTYRPAGMERALAVKVNFLAAHGFDVLVVTTDQRGQVPAFEFDSRVRQVDLGINYEETNGKPFIIKALLFPFKQIRHSLALKRLLMRERADVTVSMFCNDAPLLPRIKDGSAKVLECHFSRDKRLQYGRRGLWAFADRRLNRKDARTAASFDRFVVLTAEDREQWGAIPGIEVIPNPRTFAPEDLPPRGDLRPTVLAAGRYDAQKGFDRLLKAWAIVLRDNPEAGGWRLRIIGDGEQRRSLEALAGSLALGDSVSLERGLSDMKQAYADADIYAMTSRYEGLPMVLIEAQSASLPIVAMACKCGPRDVVSDGVDGLLTPEGDISAFAEALSVLVSDSELRARMSRSALESSGRYELEGIMGRWENLFKELSGR